MEIVVKFISEFRILGAGFGFPSGRRGHSCVDLLSLWHLMNIRSIN